MDYVAWRASSKGPYCLLLPVEKVPDSYEINEGVSRSGDFPAEACFRMDPEFPKAVKLADHCMNRDAFLVVSKRLKEWVENREPPLVEYLPVTILNHKGRVASSEYFIINPLSQQDCIDLQKSDIAWNNLDSSDISTIFELVLTEAKIDPGIPIFRLHHKSEVVLIRDDWAKEMAANGFTGLRFTPTDQLQG
jgi:hypothetical protein